MFAKRATDFVKNGAAGYGSPAGVTRCLHDVREKREGAEERLLRLVYQQLRVMAGHKMRRERIDHTLQPTALANEVYFKLLRTLRETEWKSSAHFFATCARMMRNILVDHARRRKDERQDVELLPGVAITRHRSEELIAMDRSLTRLARFDPRGAEAVELTYFLGLTQEEVAEELGTSIRTVKRDLSACLKWLRADMGGQKGEGSPEPAAGG